MTYYIKLPQLKGAKDGKAVARRVLAWLVANPEQHRQYSWTGEKVFDGTKDVSLSDNGNALNCGTTCCIGGLIALADGWTWGNVMNGGKKGETVEGHAQKRLGLNAYEAYSVLHDMRNSHALRKLAAIANGNYDCNGLY